MNVEDAQDRLTAAEATSSTVWVRAVGGAVEGAVVRLWGLDSGWPEPVGFVDGGPVDNQWRDGWGGAWQLRILEFTDEPEGRRSYLPHRGAYR